MAEFIGVVHTIQRICKRVDGRCPACILGEFSCPNNVRFDKTDEAAFRELEDVVTKWAADHPEPVYPTWWEYLTRIHVIFPAMGDFQKCVDDLATTPIPADIAQKLGLEPKEGI